MSHYVLKIENCELKIIETITFLFICFLLSLAMFINFYLGNKKRKNWVRDKKAKSRKNKKQQGTKGTL